MALDPMIQDSIEHDLRLYRRWVARLEQLGDELEALTLLTGYHTAQASQRQRRLSDPTWRAVKRRDDLLREYDDLGRRVRRVERALSAMTTEQRQLVELYYFAGATREAVESRMGISRRQFYRLRAGALETYAYVAGLIGNANPTRNSA